MNEATNNNPNNDLPTGWVLHKLDSCIEILDSQRVPINSEEREKRISNKSEAELCPYYGATGQVGWIDDYLFDEELVLLGEDGAPFLEPKNKAYIIKGKSWVNNHAHVLKAILEISSNSFLCHYLNIFDYHGYVSGTTRLKLNQGAMRQISIPIPPLPEQRIIVTRVDSLLEHVNKAKESLEKIPRIMKRFRQAALKKAFSGELTAEWRAQQQDLEPAAELLKRIRKERDRRQRQSKKTIKLEIEQLDTSTLPEDWVITRIGEITDLFSGIAFKKSEYSDQGVRLLQIANVSFGRIIWDNIVYMPLNYLEKYPELTLKAGDILMALNRPLLGGELKIGVLKETDAPAILYQRVGKFDLYNSSLKPYFFYYLKSPFFIDYLKSSLRGVDQPFINKPELLQIPFPIAPLPEQQEIVSRIGSLFKFADETEKNAREARKHVDIMTQSILARAFRGDLSADFREAVRNWKDLDAEARGRYVFVLPEEEREKVLNADEFPIEQASRLLERIGEEREKNELKRKTPRQEGRQNGRNSRYKTDIRDHCNKSK